MDFSSFLEQIKSSFKKEQLKVFNSIKPFDSLKLASMGHNDTEGYQIFTPDFIVRDMCAVVGNDIFDSSKNVLEPTSGDGAFTTYILQKRLEKIDSDFEIESLRALSTIYSIEMDKELIEKQRNNIFTVIKLFVEKKALEVDKSYFDMVKAIITTNFIWAMFNSDHPIGGLMVEAAYKMPNAAKGDFRPLDFPVWTISSNNISFHMEGVEVW